MPQNSGGGGVYTDNNVNDDGVVVSVTVELVKEPDGRATYAELLEHPFLLNEQDRDVDMVGWIERALVYRNATLISSSSSSSSSSSPSNSTVTLTTTPSSLTLLSV